MDLLFWLGFIAFALMGLFAAAAEVFGLPVARWLIFAVGLFAAAHFLWALVRRMGEWLFSLALFGLAGLVLWVRCLEPRVSAWLAPYIEIGWQRPQDVTLVRGLLLAVPLLVAVTVLYALWQRAGTPVLSMPVLPGLGRKKSPLDVRVCPGVVIKHRDRYLHTMVVGTTGTGKTSRVLKPMIWQDLKAVAEGTLAGVTVIEPKGDFAADVAQMARDLGLPVIFLNPEDPASPRFNPMEGPTDTVAEIMRTVLQSLFGRQEAFFRQAQEVTCRNTVQLLKAVKGDDVTMLDMVEALRDRTVLNAYVEAYEKMYGASGALSQFFRQEFLGGSGKMYEHILGLRLQLEDITGNALLQRVLMGKSDVNLDRHLEGGGVLVVNTAMGRLGKLGDVFGQFVMMHFQNAVFRRPGDETTRAPHVLYVDEFSRYVNPDFERLLAIGRSFRCACVLALQTTSQLLLEERPAFRDIVLEDCRNKIVLALGSAEDAKRFAAEFGENLVVRRARTLKRDPVVIFPYREDGAREEEKFVQRFDYTKLLELPKFTCVYRIVRDDQPQKPGTARLYLSEWDKKRAKAKRRRRAEVPPPAPAGVYTGPRGVPDPVRDAAKEEPFF